MKPAVIILGVAFWIILLKYVGILDPVLAFVFAIPDYLNEAWNFLF